MQGIHSIIDSEVVKVRPEDSVLNVAQVMKDNNTGYVLIEDDIGIAGVFSERDIVFRVVAESREPTKTLVREVMTTDVLTLPVNSTLLEAREIMTTHKLRHLLVHDENNKIFGMIRLFDVLKYIKSELIQEALNIEQTLESLNYHVVDDEILKGSEYRTLIVEDSTVLAKLMIRELREIGIEDTMWINNGADAIHEIQNNAKEFDLIVCDWAAPRKSGMNVLQAVREMPINQPYFLMIAEAGNVPVCLDAITFGADNYLIKPFNGASLRSRILQRWVRGAKAKGA